MADGRDNGNVIQIVGDGADSWDDQPVSATGHDGKHSEYGALEASVGIASILIHDEGQSQTRSGSEPLNKNKNVLEGDVSATGKMFFKTKLCERFMAGTCPNITDCNFAHGIEELQSPRSRKDVVVAHEERAPLANPREEFPIPSLGSSSFMVERPAQRYHKGRYCKNSNSEEVCPYGDKCSFLHDDQSKGRERERVVIVLGPQSNAGYGDGGATGNERGPAAAPALAPRAKPLASPAFDSTSKPLSWRTRICNRWEQTASCPYGSNCNFAHGVTELHRMGGGLPEPKKHVVVATTSTRIVARPSGSEKKPRGSRYPEKLNRIYGDWIDDLE